jgi:hypothetical protein
VCIDGEIEHIACILKDPTNVNEIWNAPTKDELMLNFVVLNLVGKEVLIEKIMEFETTRFRSN